MESLPDDALKSLGDPQLDEKAWSSIDHELGDLLMATAFLGSYLGRDPESLCRQAVQRFEGRFRTMETQLDGDLHRDLDELVEVWKRVKEEG